MEPSLETLVGIVAESARTAIGQGNEGGAAAIPNLTLKALSVVNHKSWQAVNQEKTTKKVAEYVAKVVNATDASREALVAAVVKSVASDVLGNPWKNMSNTTGDMNRTQTLETAVPEFDAGKRAAGGGESAVKPSKTSAMTAVSREEDALHRKIAQAARSVRHLMTEQVGLYATRGDMVKAMALAGAGAAKASGASWEQVAASGIQAGREAAGEGNISGSDVAIGMAMSSAWAALKSGRPLVEVIRIAANSAMTHNGTVLDIAAAASSAKQLVVNSVAEKVAQAALAQGSGLHEVMQAGAKAAKKLGGRPDDVANAVGLVAGIVVDERSRAEVVTEVERAVRQLNASNSSVLKAKAVAAARYAQARGASKMAMTKAAAKTMKDAHAFSEDVSEVVSQVAVFESTKPMRVHEALVDVVAAAARKGGASPEEVSRAAALAAAKQAIAAGRSKEDVADSAKWAVLDVGGSKSDAARGAALGAAMDAALSGASSADIAVAAAKAGRDAGGSSSDIGLAQSDAADIAAEAAGASAARLATAKGEISPINSAKIAADMAVKAGGSPGLVARVAGAAAARAALAGGQSQDEVERAAVSAVRAAKGSKSDVAKALGKAVAAYEMAKGTSPSEAGRLAANAVALRGGTPEEMSDVVASVAQEVTVSTGKGGKKDKKDRLLAVGKAATSVAKKAEAAMKKSASKRMDLDNKPPPSWTAAQSVVGTMAAAISASQAAEDSGLPVAEVAKAAADAGIAFVRARAAEEQAEKVKNGGSLPGAKPRAVKTQGDPTEEAVRLATPSIAMASGMAAVRAAMDAGLEPEEVTKAGSDAAKLAGGSADTVRSVAEQAAASFALAKGEEAVATALGSGTPDAKVDTDSIQEVAMEAARRAGGTVPVVAMAAGAAAAQVAMWSGKSLDEVASAAADATKKAGGLGEDAALEAGLAAAKVARADANSSEAIFQVALNATTQRAGTTMEASQIVAQLVQTVFSVNDEAEDDYMDDKTVKDVSATNDKQVKLLKDQEDLPRKFGDEMFRESMAAGAPIEIASVIAGAATGNIELANGESGKWLAHDAVKELKSHGGSDHAAAKVAGRLAQKAAEQEGLLPAKIAPLVAMAAKDAGGSAADVQEAVAESFNEENEAVVSTLVAKLVKSFTPSVLPYAAENEKRARLKAEQRAEKLATSTKDTTNKPNTSNATNTTNTTNRTNTTKRFEIERIELIERQNAPDDEIHRITLRDIGPESDEETTDIDVAIGGLSMNLSAAVADSKASRFDIVSAVAKAETKLALLAGETRPAIVAAVVANATRKAAEDLAKRDTTKMTNATDIIHLMAPKMAALAAATAAKIDGKFSGPATINAGFQAALSQNASVEDLLPVGEMISEFLATNLISAGNKSKPRWCRGGLMKSNTCCASACGECGGQNCSKKSVGASQCCLSRIKRPCANYFDVGCLVPRKFAIQVAETKRRKKEKDKLRIMGGTPKDEAEGEAINSTVDEKAAPKMADQLVATDTEEDDKKEEEEKDDPMGTATEEEKTRLMEIGRSAGDEVKEAGGSKSDMAKAAGAAAAFAAMDIGLDGLTVLSAAVKTARAAGGSMRDANLAAGRAAFDFAKRSGNSTLNTSLAAGLAAQASGASKSTIIDVVVEAAVKLADRSDELRELIANTVRATKVVGFPPLEVAKTAGLVCVDRAVKHGLLEADVVRLANETVIENGGNQAIARKVCFIGSCKAAVSAGLNRSEVVLAGTNTLKVWQADAFEILDGATEAGSIFAKYMADKAAQEEVKFGATQEEASKAAEAANKDAQGSPKDAMLAASKSAIALMSQVGAPRRAIIGAAADQAMILGASADDLVVITATAAASASWSSGASLVEAAQAADEAALIGMLKAKVANIKDLNRPRDLDLEDQIMALEQGHHVIGLTLTKAEEELKRMAVSGAIVATLNDVEMPQLEATAITEKTLKALKMDAGEVAIGVGFAAAQVAIKYGQTKTKVAEQVGDAVKAAGGDIDAAAKAATKAVVAIGIAAKESPEEVAQDAVEAAKVVNCDVQQRAMVAGAAAASMVIEQGGTLRNVLTVAINTAKQYGALVENVDEVNKEVMEEYAQSSPDGEAEPIKPVMRKYGLFMGECLNSTGQIAKMLPPMQPLVMGQRPMVSTVDGCKSACETMGKDCQAFTYRAADGTCAFISEGITHGNKARGFDCFIAGQAPGVCAPWCKKQAKKGNSTDHCRLRTCTGCSHCPSAHEVRLNNAEANLHRAEEQRAAMAVSRRVAEAHIKVASENSKFAAQELTAAQATVNRTVGKLTRAQVRQKELMVLNADSAEQFKVSGQVAILEEELDQESAALEVAEKTMKEDKKKVRDLEHDAEQKAAQESTLAAQVEVLTKRLANETKDWVSVSNTSKEANGSNESVDNLTRRWEAAEDRFSRIVQRQQEMLMNLIGTCTSLNNSDLSVFYPCTCGTALCRQGEACNVRKNLCKGPRIRNATGAEYLAPWNPTTATTTKGMTPPENASALTDPLPS
eukprot:TRINITY_DN30430_c0_g2_i1.p1 TRINITY_DN30430_c0_g2~~TRINITY_DN30430_c0_g2_i1.p1  ORF type:complete len:2838 (+),score=687.34 TRINITY_DN30430_c0_g2_i1:1008-8516(+)